MQIIFTEILRLKFAIQRPPPRKFSSRGVAIQKYIPKVVGKMLNGEAENLRCLMSTLSPVFRAGGVKIWSNFFAPPKNGRLIDALFF